MMGGVHTDINGATPLAGPVRGRRSGLRQHQRRQPARLELAARAAGVRRPRRPGGRRVRVAARTIRAESVLAQAEDEESGGSSRSSPDKKGAASASPTSARRCRRRWRTSAGIYRTGASLGQGRAGSCARCRSASATSPSRTTAGRSTPSGSRRSSCPSCSTSPRPSSTRALQREESRGAHQRTDFPARDDQRFLAHSLVYRNADGSSRVEYLPVTITRWPPAERVYGEAAPHGGPNHAAGRALPSGDRSRSRPSTSTRCPARRTGSSSTASTTSRTSSTARCRTAGRAGWASAAAAA